ncbi:MAG: hypothetical protein BWX79_01382 [Alphaproteobacteria bacterium ADurb.Bin100]|nr:MAG: hypothetical protein BWX79_01382 [Alphaproteobacteria bacterium ADurb.Bin100]
MVGHHALEAHPDLFAAPKVGAGQRVGAAQRLGRAVEHDLSAALARARAHVDHAVGRQHHSRVVLHHHQRVAGIAQALHGLDDAVHVARMQADAGLVQHEQRVHQRGAQGRGQVDALHLATAQRAALAVQREVADPDVAQVLQPGGDLFEQQLQRLRFSLVGHDVGHLGHRLEEAAQAVQWQQHQVMQTQARQGLQLGAGPGNPFRHEALWWLHHRVGIGLRTDAPEQALGLQARAAAGAAGRVAAVLGQQHPDVHLVGLGLQVFEEALDAVPVLVPLAVPVRRPLDDPVLLLGRELVPGGVSRNAGGLGMAHQVVLAFLPGWGLHRLDRAGTQGELVVGNHQAVVHADHAAEAPAGLASTDGRVEREGRGDRIGVAQVAVGAVQSRREAPQLGIRRFRAGGHHVDVQSTRAALERHLDRLDHTGFFHLPDPEAVGNHVQHLDHPHAPRCAWFAAPRGGARLFGAARHGARTRPDRTDLFPLGLHAGEAAGRQPLLQLLRAGVGRQFHRKGQHQPRLVAFGAAPQ